jgi:hypothetical protein
MKADLIALNEKAETNNSGWHKINRVIPYTLTVLIVEFAMVNYKMIST